MLRYCFILLLLFPVVSFGQSLDNEKSLLKKERKIMLKKWKIVETAFQRRLDLLPQFEPLLKDAFPQSNQLLVDVLKAGDDAKLQQVDDFESLENLDFYQIISAQDSLFQCIENLYVACEEYPDIKAESAFIGLFANLFETDNDIYLATKEYDEAVTKYNDVVEKYNEFITSYNESAKQNEESPEMMEVYLLYLHYNK